MHKFPLSLFLLLCSLRMYSQIDTIEMTLSIELFDTKISIFDSQYERSRIGVNAMVVNDSSYMNDVYWFLKNDSNNLWDMGFNAILRNANLSPYDIYSEPFKNKLQKNNIETKIYKRYSPLHHKYIRYILIKARIVRLHLSIWGFTHLYMFDKDKLCQTEQFFGARNFIVLNILK